MKRHVLWIYLVTTFILVGILCGAPTRTTAPTPTPTPTVAPRIKPKQVPAATPAPSAASKKINVIKVDKTTPTPSPTKVLRRDTSTPTPTPKAVIRNYPPPPASTATPGRIPKETVVPPPPEPKKIVAEPTQPPRQIVTPPKDVVAPPPSSKRLVPGTTNVTPIPVPVPNPAPASPAPKPVNHTLRIFTKEGHGTTSTNLGGEFPAKLDVYANVTNEFALKWSRDTAGPGENGNLHITKVSGTSPLGTQSVALPASTKETNIGYTMPNLAPGTYELLVAGDQGNSNRVTVNFSGAKSTDVTLPQPTQTQSIAPASGTITVTLHHFKPMKGTPPGSYTQPRLSYTVTASSDMICPAIDFEIDSSAFTDAETLTSSGPASYPPLKLFQKQTKGGFKLHANTPQAHAVKLDATSDFHWFLAYGKTESATFRWSGPGVAGNSEQHPLQKSWP